MPARGRSWCISGCDERHGDRPLQGGFTLVEAVVALLLLALVLVFSLVTLFAYPRYTHRLASRTEAYRTAEAVLETVRSGQIPVVPGEYTLPRVFAPLDEREEVRVRLVVEAEGRPDLYRVEVTVTTSKQGESHEVALETLAWSPGR